MKSAQLSQRSLRSLQIYNEKYVFLFNVHCKKDVQIEISTIGIIAMCGRTHKLI